MAVFSSTIRFTALIVSSCAALASCAGVSGPSVQVISQASATPYFSLSRPGVYTAGAGLALSGRVCRRGRTTLLSPSAVRLEHLDANGAMTETVHAGVGPIYGRVDQACASYSAHVSWILAQGDTVKACFDRGHACPVDPSVKAVVVAPTGAAPAPSSP